jgi:CubicO group peptidase (beta-lactamase class C family)
MQLAEQGRLDIDVPLSRYIPDFSIKSRFEGDNTITIRHLLSHKSGIIRDYYAGIMGHDLLTSDELVDALNREYLCYAAGTAYKYSNVGYSLLGLVIEKVSGEKYEDYMQRHILTPLKLNSSAFRLTPEIQSNLALGTMRNAFSLVPQRGEFDSSMQVPYMEIRDIAAGGLLTNVLELTKFIQFLIADKNKFTPHLVSNSTFKEMCTVQFQDAPHANLFMSDYGLGLKLNKFNFEGTDDVVYHDGNVNGFYSILAFSKKQKIGIVILANSESGVFLIYRMVMQGLKNFIEAKTGERIDDFKKENEEHVTISRHDLQKYVGWYATIGVSVEIVLKGDELHLKTPAAPHELVLVPVGEHTFKAVARILFFTIDVAQYIGFDSGHVRFRMKGEKSDYLFVEGSLKGVKASLALESIENYKITDEFRDYCGVYEIVRNEKTGPVLDLYLPVEEYELKIKQGWLMLTALKLPVALGVVLRPVAHDEAVILGSGETLYFKDDSISFAGLVLKRKN